MTEGDRPNPDALLAQAQEAKRGKLKVFLGAAPGVGKTFEMLSAAHRKKSDKVDVVVGIVETHRRKETEALLAGLEVIPRRKESYKGHVLEEMDLDAILARRPQLVLVDELAHSNGPGSRHPKRHQDVEELLAAGIDVYSTLNIQHLETLNDVVAQITQVRVRETVPDSVLDDANEVEVVDLTPEDLMQRLREGKVYQGEGGERALANYFTTGNLTALRELALRRTAESVDEQLREHRRVRGVSDVWAAGERVMVCVNEMLSAQKLVRYARRVANHFDAPWMAVYLETSRSLQLTESQKDRVAETLRLAESLGAETLSLPVAGSIAEAVLRVAREHNVTQLIVGKSRRSRWFELLHGSVVRELVKKSGNITVQVIAEEEPEPRPRDAPATLWDLGKPSQYVGAIMFTALSTAIAVTLDRLAGMSNVAFIFLPGVLLGAVRFSVGPALFGALLAALAYNFFLIDPLYTLSINSADDVLAFIAFLVVALMVSLLTLRTRKQTEMAVDRAQAAAELLSFSRRLTAVRKIDDLLKATAEYAWEVLRLETAMITPEADGLKTRVAVPAGAALDAADLAAAQWCLDKGQIAGRGADTLPGAARLFLPLRSGDKTLGVMGVRRAQEDSELSPPERRLLEALADLAAIALERIRLAKDMDQNKMLAETEKLRSALLNSISHDLRTPLASIHGSITSLLSFGKLHRAAARDELLGTALEETERLTRFVNNLLDMTRLDSGALKPKSEACDLHDIVGSALRRCSKQLAKHKVSVEMPDDLPMVMLDPVLTEQVLANLLDNAAKYSPEGGAIEVIGGVHRFATTLTVRDEGPGIAPEDMPRLFDFFHRVRGADRQRAGTGLGLAICRGFVQAMGGRIHAHNRRDRSGGAFEIEFPSSLTARQLDSTA